MAVIGADMKIVEKSLIGLFRKATSGFLLLVSSQGLFGQYLTTLIILWIVIITDLLLTGILYK